MKQSSSNALSVYKLFRLARFEGNRYHKTEGRRVDRERVVVKDSYAARINEQWESTGKWYEKDEAATEEFRKEMASQKNARDVADAASVEMSLSVAEAVSSIKKAGRTKKETKE